MTPEFRDLLPPQARWVFDAVTAVTPVEVRLGDRAIDAPDLGFDALAQTTISTSRPEAMDPPEIVFFESAPSPESAIHELLHVFFAYVRRFPSLVPTDPQAELISEAFGEIDTARAMRSLFVDTEIERRTVLTALKELDRIPEDERPLAAALAWLQIRLVFPEVESLAIQHLMRHRLVDYAMDFEQRVGRWFRIGPHPLDQRAPRSLHHVARIAAFVEAGRFCHFDPYFFEISRSADGQFSIAGSRSRDSETTLVEAARVLQPRLRDVPSRQEQALPPAQERPAIRWPTTPGLLAPAYRRSGNNWTATIYAADLGDQVQAGQLAADSVTAGTIAAGAIRATDAVFQAGAIQDADIGNLSANKITTGFLSADRIFGGTISGLNVNIVNLNASNITSGTLAADRIGAGTIAASVTLTSPTLLISSGGVTTNIDGSNYIKVTNNTFGATAQIDGSGFRCWTTANPSRYGVLTTGGLTVQEPTSGDYVDINPVRISFSTGQVITKRQPAVSSPSAEVNSLKTAVDALRQRLQTHGLIY